MIGFRGAGNSLDETRNQISLLIAPRVAKTAPMVVETLLHFLHLLIDSFLSIALHATVERGVDFQTIGIRVELRTVFLDIFSNRLTEIEGFAIVGTLNTEIQFQRRFHK